jgi:hypothetical protein
VDRPLSTILVIGLLVIAALTGWAIFNAVRDVTSIPQGLSGGVATQVQQIIHPTPTIYPDPVTVIKEVRDLSRLETAQYTIEKVITAETRQGALAGLFGDRLLFVAHGEVIAGVDLGKVQASDIRVAPDGSVTLILPAAEIFVATLDNDQSYVYDRQTGIFTNADQNLETQARQVAEDEIEKAALEDGVLTLAQTNAASFMESLLRSLGYASVTIIQGTPIPTVQPR